MNNWWELKPEDFPEGEPVLKMKRGLWYRDNNSGYTNNIGDAGLYDREEAIRSCFDSKGKNGQWDVIAVPVRLALRAYSSSDIQKKIDKLRDLLLYAEVSSKSKHVVF